MKPVSDHDDLFSSKWINLAEKRLGTQVLFANDDFFASKDNLIEQGRGIFIPDKYTERGKWMDGWESRRRRTPGHDHCIVRLGLPGIIHGFDIDTNHFLGNHPPFASVDACEIEGDPDENTQWTEILAKSHLDPGSQNLFAISNLQRWTHLRLNIYPDGGVARFRVYGEVSVDWDKIQDTIDLVAVENGGKVVTCNDMFFSSKDNLIMPGRGVNMGDGWETKRRRTPGNDWVILALGKEGYPEKVEVDTAHFKGNYPDRFRLEGVKLTEDITQLDLDSIAWQEIIPETKLQADHQHYYENLSDIGSVTHIRMSIYPDGGISRLRVSGKVVDKLNTFNEMDAAEAEKALLKCCHCKTWAQQMLEGRSYTSRRSLYEKALAVEATMTKENWLEAFEGHPRIGDLESLKAKYSASKNWSSKEQSGVDGAKEETLVELADWNEKYFQKFGYIFIVCATGKSAEEMLSLLKQRMDNSEEKEIEVAAKEQSRISQLRLAKML